MAPVLASNNKKKDGLTFDKAFYWPDLRSGNKTYDKI